MPAVRCAGRVAGMEHISAGLRGDRGRYCAPASHQILPSRLPQKYRQRSLMFPRPVRCPVRRRRRSLPLVPWSFALATENPAVNSGKKFGHVVWFQRFSVPASFVKIRAIRVPAFSAFQRFSVSAQTAFYFRAVPFATDFAFTVRALVPWSFSPLVPWSLLGRSRIK